MTYNILANCYSETALAKEKLYPYCPLEYLEFKYRRILLVHEIKSNITFGDHLIKFVLTQLF
jgi:mRNA deadenylase 3'-5' endonuclease subunit Ccr4